MRDDRNPQGIVADVQAARVVRVAGAQRLSGSYWRAVRRSAAAVAGGRGLRARQPREALDRLMLSLAALTGFAIDDMTHDEGWRLMRVGRRLERLQFLAGLLAQHLLSARRQRGRASVEWLLEACDSLVIYRSRYVAAPRLGPALDLLIRDAEHPRALAFQWNAMSRDLAGARDRARSAARREGLDHARAGARRLNWRS